MMLVTAGFSVSVRLARIANRTACVSKVTPIVSQNRLFFHRERRLGTAIPNRSIGNNQKFRLCCFCAHCDQLRTS
jgi:hypothetical protein